MIKGISGLDAPHFVMGSDRIYATQRGAGLVSMRWDGTDRKEHVQVRGGAPGGGQGPAASVIRMAPEGDQAMALVGNQLYVVTVPSGVGADAPTISVANPSSAAFPAEQLTDIGAQFPAWGANSREVHWALGNAHFVYDLDDAQAFADSVEAAEAAEDETEDAEEEEGTMRTTTRMPDTAPANRGSWSRSSATRRRDARADRRSHHHDER